MVGFCVYKHTCPNGKVYVGMTRQNPIYRWDSGRGYSKNKHFYRAILKYGWDNIKHEILLSGLTEEEAKAEEIRLIGIYNSTNPKFGYNKTLGGDYRCHLTRRSIEKLIHSLTGKKRTPEQIEHYKIGASKRSKRLFLSEEHKKKISESLLGNKRALGNDKNSINVMQYSLDGLYIATFLNAKVAAAAVGCDSSGINRSCRENESANIQHTKYKGKYAGYKWFYSRNNKSSRADKLGGVVRK